MTPPPPNPDPLAEYRRKRDFARTREPKGRAKRTETGALFVVQKHDARNLHYDLRLEMNGVLKSWAVPKGPSLDPAQKLLAVHVEDHPLEYASFEGVIPEGEYGGGTVMLWDRGTWEPVTDPDDAYKNGDLKFILRGEKLQGEFALVRTKGPKSAGGKNWLLIKKKDQHARPISEYNILAQQSRSVLTGRGMADIAAAPEEIWTTGGAQPTEHAGRVGEGAQADSPDDGLARIAGLSAQDLPDPSSLPGAKRASLPDRLKPALAEVAPHGAPDTDDWLHEIKFDGYRLLAVIDDGRVTLRTRNWHDWTDKFPNVAKALHRLPLQTAILDGEVVVLDSRGISDFQALQNAFRGYTQQRFIYYVFDVPYALSCDLKHVPLIERKRFLKALLESAPMMAPTVQFCDHITGRGPAVFQQAAEAGLEGIICKRANSHYETRRSPAWLKVKATRRQDFVIGGFTEPQGSRHGFGAILVGAYEAITRGESASSRSPTPRTRDETASSRSPTAGQDPDLLYCGRVGTGFTDVTLELMAKHFAARLRKTPPFREPINDPDLREVYWVEPDLVADVEYAGWTDEEVLRFPAFKGLRADLDPSDVILEEERISGDARAAEVRRKSKTQPRPPKAVIVKKTSPTVVRTGAAPADAIVRGVRITHPDRCVYPDQGFTKQAVAEYYAQVAHWILPHVAGRPLTIVRCPQGLAGDSFYQRHVGEGFPKAVRSVQIAEEEGGCIVIGDLDGLLGLVQFGVLEIHTWGSDVKHVERPDHIVFDLDPGPGIDWPHIVAGATFVRDYLERIGLTSFIKTSGGKGVHLIVPIIRRHTWDEIKTFSKAVADELARLAPRNFTATMTKALRKHRIYIDYLRNLRGSTAVAPYSTRARDGGLVSMPLTWDELSPDVPPTTWNIAAAAARLRKLKQDPWHTYATTRQSITTKTKRALNL